MRLTDLIKTLPIRLIRDAGREIVSVVDDSRKAVPGSLFIARPGADGDPLAYLPASVENGAAAVLLPEMDQAGLDAISLPDHVSILTAEKGTEVDQRLVGKVAEAFHGHRSSKLKLIGITGTNGKTTTATLVQHLLNTTGHKCGLIGTVSLDVGDAAGSVAATLTTPGAAELSELFALMVANGCEAAVMEVSSHALHQGRADALRFAAAAFTNLTQDHLDYHGTMEAYADAKAMLFESLDKDATAVLNADDPAAKRMDKNCQAKIVSTQVAPSHADAERGFASEASGTENRAERIVDQGSKPATQSTPLDPHACSTALPLELLPGQSRATFAGPWGSFDATVPFVGSHNLSNLIQATALAHAVAKIPAEQLQEALQTCPPVPGRLEPVGPDWGEDHMRPKSHADAERCSASEASGTDTQQPKLPTVLVDYAHTPDALINVGQALRPLVTGKLITVFGCGGDRDRKKRPLMAQAACRYADHVILTSDNPRTEEPEQILADTAQGFPPHRPPQADAERGFPSEASGTTHQVIPDRAAAIAHAIATATPEDTVLIAGKGHEDYQIIGIKRHHFDDREQAANALRNYHAP